MERAAALLGISLLACHARQLTDSRVTAFNACAVDGLAGLVLVQQHRQQGCKHGVLAGVLERRGILALQAGAGLVGCVL